jgi:hypothetical protein
MTKAGEAAVSSTAQPPASSEPAMRLASRWIAGSVSAPISGLAAHGIPSQTKGVSSSANPGQ